MSHGVEGHQGPDGDAGVAHDSTGPQDLDGQAGPQGQDAEDPNTRRLQPDQLLLIGKCVCVCVCIYIANYFL